MYILLILFQIDWPWWSELVTMAELMLAVFAFAGGTVGIVGILKKIYYAIAKQEASLLLQKIFTYVITAVMGILSAIVAGEIEPMMFGNWAFAAKAIVMIIIVAIQSGGLYELQKRAGWFR